ncbi:MAG: hypothetical protein FWB80_04035 [Defluviitaleaceae bacterium]|nr:hypothetical protein [Defluviitaleaceae bacterium]
MTTLSRSDDHICIKGEYYTVTNGYLTKNTGEVNIPINTILSAECVKRQSKETLHIMLLIFGGGLAVVGLVYWLYNTLFLMFLGLTMTMLAVIIVIIFVVSVPAVLIGVKYFFSGQNFAEFTTLNGIYCVKIPPGDTQMENLINTL